MYSVSSRKLTVPPSRVGSSGAATYDEVLRALGLDAASAFGGFIGREIFYRTPLTARARTNLHLAFPRKSAQQIEEHCARLERVLEEWNVDMPSPLSPFLKGEGSSAPCRVTGIECRRCLPLRSAST